MNPDGNAAIPVVVVTDSQVQGGPVIPVYGYSVAPTDGRPVLGQPAMRVKVIGDSDLIANGGKYWIEGRAMAMPVVTDVSGITQGNVAIPVYLVGGSL